jgi:hypothetical protein
MLADDMISVASKYAAFIQAGRRAGYTERTYTSYNQQSVTDPTMHIYLEGEMTGAKQAYKDAAQDLAQSMNASYATAIGSAIGCAAGFALPTP